MPLDMHGEGKKRGHPGRYLDVRKKSLQSVVVKGQMMPDDMSAHAKTARS